MGEGVLRVGFELVEPGGGVVGEVEVDVVEGVEQLAGAQVVQFEV